MQLMIILEVQVQDVGEVAHSGGQSAAEVIPLQIELSQLCQGADPVRQGSSDMAIGHEEGLQFNQ